MIKLTLALTDYEHDKVRGKVSEDHLWGRISFASLNRLEGKSEGDIFKVTVPKFDGGYTTVTCEVVRIA